MNTSVELPQAKIKQFFQQFPQIKYKKQELIIRAYDQPLGIHYLVKGTVRMYCVSSEGEELTLHMFVPGSYFPLTWAIANIENNHYFQAMEDVTLHRAPKDELLTFLKSEPEILFEITQRLLLGLDGYSQRLKNTTFGNTASRTASVLLYLAEEFGVEKGSTTIINYPFTHEILATWVGMTRVSVSQAISDFQKQGILTYGEKGLLVITNKTTLLANV